MCTRNGCETSVLTLAIVWLLFPRTGFAEDSAIEALKQAKSVYVRNFEENSVSYLAYLDNQEESARNRSKPEELKKIAQIREAFIKAQQFPLSMPRAISARMNLANRRLSRVFEEAREHYLKSGDDAAAEDVRKESSQFFKHADAIEFDGSFYKVFPADVTWETANKLCEEMHGHLVTIRSQEENDFLTRIAKTSNCEKVWIGMSDKVREGVWVWVTGEPVKYTRWLKRPSGKSEPNDCCGGEDYAIFYVSEGGQWHDVKNVSTERKKGFICEWD